MKKITESFIDGYNVAVGAGITVSSTIFGAYWYLFTAFLACNIFDWLTGWYKSRKLKNESSIEGLKGVVKKLGYWVIISVAFILSYVFTRLGKDLLNIDLSQLKLLGYFTLACLLINEIRSILENLIECGFHVPNILIKGLAVADKLVNKDDLDS